MDMNVRGELHRCRSVHVCVSVFTHWLCLHAHMKPCYWGNRVKAGNRNNCSHLENLTYSWSVIRFLSNLVSYFWTKTQTTQFFFSFTVHMCLDFTNCVLYSCGNLRFWIYLFWIQGCKVTVMILSLSLLDCFHSDPFPVLTLWHAHV